MRKLASYMRHNDLSCRAMARRVGCTENSFRRYVTGWRLPSWEIMVALERVTDGEITPNDFLPFARQRLKDARAKKREPAPAPEPIAAE